MPLLPLFLASASMVLQKRSAWMLLWVSLAISALCIADPWLRFNHADGTDAVVSLFTGGTAAVWQWLPSWVHPAPLPFIAWGLFLALLVALTVKSGRGVQWSLLAAAVLLGLASRGVPGTWEAENLGPGHRTGCLVYPSDPDPLQRNYWLFRRAPLLYLGHPLDSVSLPVPPGEGPVEVSVTLCGMAGEDGSIPAVVITSGGQRDLEFLDSGVRPSPGWVRTHRKADDIGRLPENMEFTTTVCSFTSPGDSIFINAEWTEGFRAAPAGLYLDRIDVRRR